jgi:mRNA interferase HigB
MHVVSKKRLRQFWEVHPDAERPLRRWFRTATKADRQSFADVRATYAHADRVGRFTVFIVAGNKYRPIAAIHLDRGKVYVRNVLIHAEYNRGAWKED